MELITKELKARFAEIGDQSELDNPIVVAKFFDPTGSATWYATEYDEERNVCFGYVAGLAFDEFGSFSIDELESLKRPFGLTIERDLYFKEKTFSELEKEIYPENKTPEAHIQNNNQQEIDDLRKSNESNDNQNALSR